MLRNRGAERFPKRLKSLPLKQRRPAFSISGKKRR
jgi:hypothetical protein